MRSYRAALGPSIGRTVDCYSGQHASFSSERAEGRVVVELF